MPFWVPSLVRAAVTRGQSWLAQRSAARTAKAAAARSLVGRQIGTATVVADRPGHFPSSAQVAGSLVANQESRSHRFLNVMWGLDSLKARYDRSSPTFAETVMIRVYGQRWATIEDLYILAMCILVDLVDGKTWQGGQGVRCLIDRTGKYVEVEFQQTKQAMAENAASLISLKPVSDPVSHFHNPDWLGNEIKVPSHFRVRERIPDVLVGWTDVLGRQIFDNTADRNDLIKNGNYTANRVANQTLGYNDGIRLVTHARDVNPAPVADGLSRGTDLTALIAQALHESCDPPPRPDTDREYKLVNAPDPGGCNLGVRVDGTQIGADRTAWWFARVFQKWRWLLGWKPADVTHDSNGFQGLEGPRNAGPQPCQ